MGWFSRRRGTGRPVLEPDDRRARPIGLSYDDAAASSTVLSGAGVDPERPVILRHLLWLPSGASESARGLAAQEQYVPGPELPEDPSAPAGLEPTVLVRVQRVDARTVSQERSRMASLASRHGGVSVGWAVMDVADGQGAPGD